MVAGGWESNKTGVARFIMGEEGYSSLSQSGRVPYESVVRKAYG